MYLGLKNQNVQKLGVKAIHSGAKIGVKASDGLIKISPILGLAGPEASILAGAVGAAGKIAFKGLEKISK